MTIIRSEAAATIFSRRSAPPPPLIRLSSGSISSAPSTVKSSRSTPSSVVRRIPQRSASWRVASEVGTPITSSPSRTRAPRSSTKCLAVDPVPRPSFIPSLTYSSARAAACRFSSSEFTCEGPQNPTPLAKAARHGPSISLVLRRRTAPWGPAIGGSGQKLEACGIGVVNEAGFNGHHQHPDRQIGPVGGLVLGREFAGPDIGDHDSRDPAVINMVTDAELGFHGGVLNLSDPPSRASPTTL